MTGYSEIRHFIKTGDILLFHSKKAIARAIQIADSAYYHHSGVAIWVHGRLFILDAQPEGNGLGYLSNRWKEKQYQDICVLRPTVGELTIISALQKTIAKVEQFNKYDFGQLVYVLKRKYLKIGSEKQNNKFICSELTQDYGYNLGISAYVGRDYFTPEDHYRIKTPILTQIR